ncbi:MAG: response regulator [Flavisolibacter sp.]
MKKIRLQIIDDHALIRETWACVFNAHPEFEVVGTAATALEGIDLARQLRPDVLTMDLNLPDINGIEATERLHSTDPDIKILGISQHLQPAYAKKMMQNGAHGYITKSSPIDEMFKAIQMVYQGNRYISADVKDLIAEQMMNLDEEKAGVQALSKRELEIIEYIKEGMTSREIADKLFISTKTADAHRYNILRKLKLKNTAALINYVNQYGVAG